jgi:hypothetical protein
MIPVASRSLCGLQLVSSVYHCLDTIIRRRFVAHVYVRKLPETFPIGILSRDNQSLLYTHHRFTLHHNSNHIVEVKITPEKPVALKPQTNLEFTYSVDWSATSKPYRSRTARYCDLPFAQAEVRKYAVVNSFVLAFLLFFLAVFVITKFVNADSRRAEIDEFQAEPRADSGWKLVHADVFRVPAAPGFLSMLIGFGSQALSAAVGFVIANLVFRLFLKYNSTLIVGFIVYAISGVVGGYFSGRFYRRWTNSRDWIAQTSATAAFGPTLFVFWKIVMAIPAAVMGAGQTIHYATWFTGALLFAVVVLPLTFVGAITGRHWFFSNEDEARVSLNKRAIPPTPFYLRTFAISAVIGVCFVFLLN